MLKQCIVTLAAAGILAGPAIESTYAQKDRRDKGEFVVPKNAFWDNIKESTEKFDTPKKQENKAFKLDFSNIDAPKSKDEFKSEWHNAPISQGWTGTCWCFSTTSYMESEIARLTGKKLKISELHSVYWEYVEKAKRFIRERGNSNFAEGGETNGLIRIWKEYGCVPAEAYTGLPGGREFHSHEKMAAEMNAFLQSLKQNNNWNEEMAISTIKSILNHYIGEPPAEFDYNGRKYTPKSFLEKEIGISMDDYVDIMSLKQFDYWTKAEYPAADNWWHSAEYYNVPLDEFMSCLKDIQWQSAAMCQKQGMTGEQAWEWCLHSIYHHLILTRTRASSGSAMAQPVTTTRYIFADTRSRTARHGT